MPVSILDLKELQEKMMHCLSFITVSGTGTCANMSGNLKNIDQQPVRDAGDV